MADAKFRVGDRVEAVSGSYGATVGQTYTVTKVERFDYAGDFWVWLEGLRGSSSDGSLPEGDFKLADWKPKVGDRVRYSGRSSEYNEPRLVGIEGTVTDVGQLMASVEWDDSVFAGIPTGGDKYFANLEPVSQGTENASKPVEFKIEAGKFYRTRDGRKVGPMTSVIGKGYDPEWKWRSPQESSPVADDGHWDSRGREHANDLIGEWGEPVAQLATASNDNTYPPMRLKVGDRVVSVSDGRTKGHFGEIIADDGTSVPYLVRFDDWRDGHGSGDREWWLQAHEVQTINATAIVALIENGKPKPAAVPYVHATEELAVKEAQRLAGKHKGQKFGVFVLTTTREEAAPTYAYEWQRLAKKGETIAAIKELRRITGLGLKATKDAVEHWVANDEPYSRVAA